MCRVAERLLQPTFERKEITFYTHASRPPLPPPPPPPALPTPISLSLSLMSSPSLFYMTSLSLPSSLSSHTCHSPPPTLVSSFTSSSWLLLLLLLLLFFSSSSSSFFFPFLLLPLFLFIPYPMTTQSLGR